MYSDRQSVDVGGEDGRDGEESDTVTGQGEYEVFAFREWMRQELGGPLLAAFRGSRAGRRKERG